MALSSNIKILSRAYMQFLRSESITQGVVGPGSIAVGVSEPFSIFITEFRSFLC